MAVEDTHSQSETVKITKVESEEEIERCFEVMSLAFGKDKPMFNSMYPEHDTTEGRRNGTNRLREMWQSKRDDVDFHYLKATIANQIAGFAIWTIMTPTKNLESEKAEEEFNLKAMYPDQPLAQEWLRQIWPIYITQRRDVVLADSQDDRPVIALELCAVRPDMQRKGVGVLLSSWGVQYGKENGIREAVLEASIAGVGCYTKAGFAHQSPIDFGPVDRSLTQVRNFPTIVFMRTGPLQTEQKDV
ncbi:uncharacterized protein FA14DRAFT_31378 [Meira miltonrushii]|uniref:N-acetyltransferase domain-containing protein n=1 Tax=Meira miltonrushii TaxID=1280837 RepID=A0A316VAQ3_9BASI|nr:uncharacterized protein FA14DRAFT_31378 [Meira miltonrushii]PWN34530.1 hypothetical protein FA14DRAFT_31378 [Meira miltonrushii]